MKDITKKLTKAFVTAGVACLLLGIVGHSQPARGDLEFGGGTTWVYVSGTDHYSYGDWSFPAGDWYDNNTAEGWASAYVDYTLDWGWTAWVLYSLYWGWSEEVTFLYDVDY